MKMKKMFKEIVSDARENFGFWIRDKWIPRYQVDSEGFHHIGLNATHNFSVKLDGDTLLVKSYGPHGAVSVDTYRDRVPYLGHY